MSKDTQTCTACLGFCHLEARVEDLGTHEWSWIITGCHVCDSKGYITPEDSNRVHHILNEFRSCCY